MVLLGLAILCLFLVGAIVALFSRDEDPTKVDRDEARRVGNPFW